MLGARGRRTARSCAVLGLACSAAVASGCGAPVALDPPASAPACATLADALPARLAGQERRRTEPESPTTAAWGDPPISLRCGVPTPSAYSPGSQLLAVNGADWLPEQLSDGVRFWLIGAPAVVEVTVPRNYSPEAGVLAELGPAVAQALTSGSAARRTASSTSLPMSSE